MLQMILVQIYLFLMQLLLAGKDADSYLLKSKTDDNMTSSRIARWHQDGVLLFLLAILPVLNHYWWMVILMALLMRLAIFDLAFNLWSGLSVTFLGSTAWIDKQFIKIFGPSGALKKSFVAFAVLIALNIIFLVIRR